MLDVGCGTGSTTREAALRAHPGTATGVDLSGAMTERGVELGSAAWLVTATRADQDQA